MAIGDTRRRSRRGKKKKAVVDSKGLISWIFIRQWRRRRVAGDVDGCYRIHARADATRNGTGHTRTAPETDASIRHEGKTTSEQNGARPPCCLVVHSYAA